MGEDGIPTSGFQAAYPVRLPEPGAWFRAVESHDGLPIWLRAQAPEDPPRAVQTAFERLRHLDHPSIPKVVGWDAEAGVLAVAAPDGVPLRHLITHRSDPELMVTPGTLLDLGLMLADAIVHAHERGRPHGHLSPDTVWVAGDGSLVLWGFGEGPSGEPPGAWLAPERARGRRASGDADQWALGALLAAVVTGREPWTEPEALLQAQAGDAGHLSEPVMAQWKPLGRVVQRALASQPRDRFPSAHPVRGALEAMAQRAGQASDLGTIAGVLMSRYGTSGSEVAVVHGRGAAEPPVRVPVYEQVAALDAVLPRPAGLTSSGADPAFDDAPTSAGTRVPNEEEEEGATEVHRLSALPPIPSAIAEGTALDAPERPPAVAVVVEEPATSPGLDDPGTEVPADEVSDAAVGPQLVGSVGFDEEGPRSLAAADVEPLAELDPGAWGPATDDAPDTVWEGPAPEPVVAQREWAPIEDLRRPAPSGILVVAPYMVGALGLLILVWALVELF